MSGAGRPLRFLVMVTGGWTGLRVFMLWPRIDGIAALTQAILPTAAAAPPPAAIVVAARPAIVRPAQAPAVPVASVPNVPDQPLPAPASPIAAAVAATPVAAAPIAGGGIVAGLPRPAAATAGSRWSGSAWLVARGGRGLGAGVVGGQLGGSQAGARIAYLLDRRRRIALAARVSSPLGAGQRELALGVEWQPTRLPVRLVAEQRIAIGGRGGATIGAVGGFGPLPVGHGVRIEGYGQAGVIARGGGESFADGALHAAHALAALGRVRFDLGGGVWGAAQKGAARLDLGPSLSAVVPVARQSLRLSLDWRQRVAGEARPGSGVVFSIGADF